MLTDYPFIMEFRMFLSASFSEVHSFGAGTAVWFRRIEVMLSIKTRKTLARRCAASVQGGGETVLRISSEPLPVHYREGQGTAGTSMAYDICR